MGDRQDRAVEVLKGSFPDQVLFVGEHAGQKFAGVRRDRIVEILRTLRDHPDLRFDALTDLCGTDFLNQDAPERFCVVYNLYSFANNERFRVKAFAPETDPSIDSASGLWKAADWAEREAFDMYGIRFRGHPGLKRILLPEDYGSHPLRKDYPVTGLGERERFPRYRAPEKR